MPDQPSLEPRAALRRFAWLAFVAAFFTYALIVFGGIVRITGSGMGCGDDWPLCHGRLIPPLDLPTLIEYGHRLAALLVSVLVLAVALYAIRHRRSAGFAQRQLVALAVAALVMLVVQVMVGAVTVWLELPTATVVLHLGLAAALLATLIVAGLRARVAAPAVAAPGTYANWARATAVLGFVLLLLGALVANTGAAPLCQGFPLCNGQLFPEGGALVHVHWTHRLFAYALLVVAALAVAATARQKAPAGVARAAVTVLCLVIAQIVVAAVLVITELPGELRALHLALGIALWAALVAWDTLARSLPEAGKTA
jgi:heme A synthase